jgi:diacylglycerol kinase (ATP)
LGLKIVLVVKPPADDAKLDELRGAVAALRSDGHRVRVRLTFEAGDARRCARGAALRGADVVVAAGGDGTLNEVVNGLVAAGGETALAVVPLGTANDFARMLELPEDTGECLRCLVGGAAVALDVAEVNRRCFINVSTGGFGAAASQNAGRGAKRMLGALAYVVTGAQRLVNFEPMEGLIRADGEVVHRGPFMFYAVGNGRWTGGGTRITPDADPGDGRLDVVIGTADSRLDLLTLLPSVRAGNHLDDEDIHYVRASQLEVRTRSPIAVNADGQPVAGGRRFRYRVLERRLSLLLPG